MYTKGKNKLLLLLLTIDHNSTRLFQDLMWSTTDVCSDASSSNGSSSSSDGSPGRQVIRNGQKIGK